jgi:FtsP/CotA-like multicopper oxidase with cupredoxin domain
MSTHEQKVRLAMRAPAFKKTRALLVLVVAAAALPLAGSMASAAPVAIDLCASNGQVTMPDSTVVDVWGFVQTASCGPNLVNDTNFPGAPLAVNEGDVVTINITNALPPDPAPVADPPDHKVRFEIPGITFNPGATEAAVGDSVTVAFTASAPGTYQYQSGGDAGRQEAMGLYGALIVRSLTAAQAYDAATTAYDVEATLVLSAIDPNFNGAPDTYDLHAYRATYWLINGKPYTPTAPGITAAAGQRLLLRYVNAGFDNTSMQLLGMHQQVLARDARLLNNPFFASAETIPAGGTEDAIATVPSTAPPSANGFPLYNRQLHLTNGAQTGPTPAPASGGGMLTFIHP